MSPFECSIGYLPPLFPSQEPDAAVPSALAFMQRCCSVWKKARKALVQASRGTKAATDRHQSPVPRYVCGQKVWLSTKDLPLKAVSHKLAPRFIDPYQITKIINPPPPSSSGWFSGLFCQEITRCLLSWQGFSIPGRLGGLRSRGEELGSGSGHSGSVLGRGLPSETR